MFVSLQYRLLHHFGYYSINRIFTMVCCIVCIFISFRFFNSLYVLIKVFYFHFILRFVWYFHFLNETFILHFILSFVLSLIFILMFLFVRSHDCNVWFVHCFIYYFHSNVCLFDCFLDMIITTSDVNKTAKRKGTKHIKNSMFIDDSEMNNLNNERNKKLELCLQWG